MGNVIIAKFGVGLAENVLTFLPVPFHGIGELPSDYKENAEIASPHAPKTFYSERTDRPKFGSRHVVIV